MARERRSSSSSNPEQAPRGVSPLRVLGRLIALGALTASVAGVFASCLELRDDRPRESVACTSCHGSPDREGDALVKAAPPFDLLGQTAPQAPGVGAHLVHLTDNGRHALVACDECHIVPKTVDAPGHADSNGPAEIVFGSLARTKGHAPGFVPDEHSCNDTYCHGGTTVAWPLPADPQPSCGTCHGLPPALPHPQSTQCYRCHGDVVDENRDFVAPYKHVNGKVEVTVGCSSCHGTEASNGAPPPALDGSTDPSDLGVGAHERHLAGGTSTRPVACGECHVVPATVADPGHLDAALPAELTFSGAAVAYGATPSWDRVARQCSDSWCHGPTNLAPNPIATSPDWTAPAAGLGCTDCHGQPPAPPHPQMTDCARCHGAVIDANGAIIDRSLHVNGVVDFAFTPTCGACHGTEPTGAPPPDLSGNMSSAAVGAHQKHLGVSTFARTVLCSECHQVPSDWLDPGHLDSDRPAELTFSGVATSGGASPSYTPATHQCTNVYCHGNNLPFGGPSGGTYNQPDWTVPGPMPVCTRCHGQPPPPPHQQGVLTCVGSLCHIDIFANTQLHVNGQVNFMP